MHPANLIPTGKPDANFTILFGIGFPQNLFATRRTVSEHRNSPERYISSALFFASSIAFCLFILPLENSRMLVLSLRAFRELPHKRSQHPHAPSMLLRRNSWRMRRIPCRDPDPGYAPYDHE
jgi:hypothetical protein